MDFFIQMVVGFSDIIISLFSLISMLLTLAPKKEKPDNFWDTIPQDKF